MNKRIKLQENIHGKLSVLKETHLRKFRRM